MKRNGLETLGLVAVPASICYIIHLEGIKDIIILIVSAVIGTILSIYLLRLQRKTTNYNVYLLYKQIEKIDKNILEMMKFARGSSEHSKLKILEATKYSLEKQILNILLDDIINICKKVELNPRNGINIQKELDELESLQKLSKIGGEK